MPSKKLNSNSAKPKSSRKRRGPSLNFNPKPSKKRAVASNERGDNKEDSDFIEEEIKTTRHEQNEENASSVTSKSNEDEEESGTMNKTTQNTQPIIVASRNQQTLSRRKTPALSQRNTTSSSVSSVSAASQFLSPELSVGEENSLENQNGFQILTDKNFMQQQVQLLTTSFNLQDCPGLADKQNKRKKCIPHDVIQDALRKLHHKMDDEIQKHLNRQSQRKVLSQLREIEKDMAAAVYEDPEEQRENHFTETMSVSKILEKCFGELDDNGDTDCDLLRRHRKTIVELQTLNDEMENIKQKIASCESNNLMVLEVEYLAREATQRSLRNEVERTNKLVKQVTRVLRRKADSP